MRVLENFIFSKYLLTIIPTENLTLPPYKGSTLRGGFGSVFSENIILYAFFNFR
jgi:hypothetical protein